MVQHLTPSSLTRPDLLTGAQPEAADAPGQLVDADAAGADADGPAGRRQRRTQSRQKLPPDGRSVPDRLAPGGSAAAGFAATLILIVI